MCDFSLFSRFFSRIRHSFLPTWEARVSFWAPWAEVPQDGGRPLLRKKISKGHGFTGNLEMVN